jgi:AbrB family looped-hinge helix DNA binding protein
MALAQITQSGNVFLPKSWRDELGIKPNTKVVILKQNNRIVIEPLLKKTLAQAFKEIDEEIKQKNIKFTRKEAIRDDLYD